MTQNTNLKAEIERLSNEKIQTESELKRLVEDGKEKSESLSRLVSSNHTLSEQLQQTENELSLLRERIQTEESRRDEMKQQMNGLAENFDRSNEDGERERNKLQSTILQLNELTTNQQNEMKRLVDQHKLKEEELLAKQTTMAAQIKREKEAFDQELNQQKKDLLEKQQVIERLSREITLQSRKQSELQHSLHVSQLTSQQSLETQEKKAADLLKSLQNTEELKNKEIQRSAKLEEELIDRIKRVVELEQILGTKSEVKRVSLRGRMNGPLRDGRPNHPKSSTILHFICSAADEV
ncbi:hypothetical protein BLNAU_13018 [Blattamonas nauphoetae]|uniref:Uncharacterized protein n=1 Tax=Blattamonas nauphoetae TaxID=2049346 RepID=A0ABQ9XJ31_9EUKA|nr:hypothetical protein BLNAU_13018 [Blattamonas nauphoetae]